PLDEVEDWLAGVRAFWDQRLDALDTELRRGARSTQPAVSNDDPPHDLPHDQGNDEGARP
ncbi:MAG TPA: hypothetical protein VIM26_05585, partial [Pengzhenrongella sp.]